MRTRGMGAILTATLVVAAGLTSAAKAVAAEPVKTTVSHKAWQPPEGVPSADVVDNPSCTRPLDANVWEPAAPGRYPVAIVTIGTAGSITGTAYQELAKEFARQDFVAIVVDYNTYENFPIPLNRIKAKANCTYTPTRPESAMTKVCARAKADCAKGIVTSGQSQGGALALFAYDYDRRIAAAHVWGVGNGTFPLAKSRVRVIAGQEDKDLKQPADLNKMTGLSCYSEWECFIGSNGSGWRRVKNDEVEDGNADHCFTVKHDGNWLGACFAREPSTLDRNTMSPSMNWSYPANVTWLKTFVTP